MGASVTSATRELLGIVRILETRTETRRSLIGAAIAISNFFLCAFCERFLIGPGWHEAMGALLAIECTLLVTLAMAIQLQLVSPILDRTRIHPATSHDRFTFVTITLLRHRYILLFWGSTMLSVTLMLHPTLTSAIPIALSVLIPGAILVVASAALLVGLRHWNSSGLVGLAILGMVACVISGSTIIFPESHLLGLLMPLRWMTLACAAAMTGDFGRSALLILPFVPVGWVAWIGGARYA
jgi:hypothetical protein